MKHLTFMFRRSSIRVFEITRPRADHASQGGTKSELRSLSAFSAAPAVKKRWGVVLAAVVGMGAVGQGFVGGDILFDLARSARSAGLGGAGLALPAGDALFLNPAGLPWVAGVELISSYGNQFDAVALGVVSVGLPGLAAAGIVLDAGVIGPGLTFRTVGAAFGAGVRLGPLGAGAAARLLRPVAPVPGLGGALDFGLLFQGPLHVGAVWRGILSQSPVRGEFWPPELALGIALPLRFQGMTAAVAVDAVGIGADLAFAVGGEFGADWLLVRAGYGPGGATLGGTVGWGPFALDWAILLHSVLPAAFRVSFTLRL